MDVLEIIKGKAIYPIVDDISFHSFKLEQDNRDNRIQPITLGQIQELKDQGYECPDVSVGTILMRHPYRPNTLELFSTDTFDFIRKKLQDYCIILNLLGAKKQALSAKCVKISKREVYVDGRIKIKALKLSGKFQQRKINKVYQESATEISAGMKEWSHNKALLKAQELGLNNDRFISTMLQLRRERPVDSYKAKFEIGSEYNELMDIAAKMEVMHGIFNLSGTFKQDISVVQKVFIDQNIEFVND